MTDQISGSVDLRGRPLIRLSFVGHEDEMLATVDTGFNGQLFLTEAVAKIWGIAPFGVGRNVVLGDGSIVATKQSISQVQWLGEVRDVLVQVTTHAAAANVGAAQNVDDPVALIGTNLLARDILEINFRKRLVNIRRSD